MQPSAATDIVRAAGPATGGSSLHSLDDTAVSAPERAVRASRKPAALSHRQLLLESPSIQIEAEWRRIDGRCLLRDAARPIDARSWPKPCKFHVTTARFHLAGLEAQGYVRLGSARPVGAGRPKLAYELAPRLDYTDIVSLFTAHLAGDPQERQRRARRIGVDLILRPSAC